MLTTEQRQARARLANLTARAYRSGADPNDDPAVGNARRDFRLVSATRYVADLVDAAPPLTREQRDKLALLLRTEGGARDANTAA